MTAMLDARGVSTTVTVTNSTRTGKTLLTRLKTMIW